MRIVVFGGAGFLGSHTADVLESAGHDVVIFDRNPSQYLGPKSKMVVGDINDREKVEETVIDTDIVYNFSGVADIQEAVINPLKAIETNVLGNSIILDACVKSKIERFIFASSMYVYSDLGSIYGASKQASEIITESYSSEFNLPFTILRYGSLYGPRASKWNGVYRLLKQAIEERKIRFEGSGNEIREFIHVMDAAKLSVKAIEEEYKNQYLMLTGSERMKYTEIIDMINEILGGDLIVEISGNDKNNHYILTPYTFKPRVAKKIVSTEFHDLGQGLLESISEIFDEIRGSQVD